MTRIIGVIVIVLLIVGAAVWYGANRESDADLNQPELSVQAFNDTQGRDATQVAARPQDTISFSLYATNPTAEIIPGYVVSANIENIARAATLIDAGGASYNSATNALVWTPLDIGPNQTIENKFLVRVNDLLEGSTQTEMSISHDEQLTVLVSKDTSTVSGESTVSPAPSQPYTAPTSGPSLAVTAALAAISTVLAIRVSKKWKTS